MCTPFAHALAGYSVLVLGEPRLSATLRSNLHALGAGFVFGSMADADFLVAYYTKVPELQHHFFTHSIFFTLVIGVATYLFLRIFLQEKVLRSALILTAAYGSHLILDYFTHDGSPPIGIPLFWPFTDLHFVAAVDIFLSIHRGSMQALFGAHNFTALFREALILGPVALLAYHHSRKERRL
jgi:membrane-bound metal-dependent hydrolase YbcI (DUF457 family)